MTKDERFVIALYQAAEESNKILNPMKIGKELGMKEHLIQNILRGLMQANFVQRKGEGVILTDHGRRLAQDLISSN